MRRREVVATCLLLLLAVLVTYRAAPQNAYHFDDYPHIVNNPSVRVEAADAASLRSAWSGAYLENRRLAYVSFAIDWARGSGAPAAFLQTNIAIHAATTLAVLCLLSLVLAAPCRRLTRPALLTAAAGAALWAAHPIQVQAVTYVVQRMASLAALFTVLTVVCYLLARRHGLSGRGIAWGVLGLLCLLAGASSKETAWITPLLLVTAEYGVVRAGGALFRSDRERILVLTLLCSGVVLFLSSCLGFGPIADRFEGSYGSRDFDMRERLLTQPRVILYHLGQIAWPDPDRFSLVHDFPASTSLWSPWTTGPAIVAVGLIGIGGLLLLRRRDTRRLGFLVLWIPASLLIESSFVPLELIFEHRMYLPSVGVFGAVAWALLHGLRSPRPAVRLAVLTPVVIFGLVSALATSRYVPVWRSHRTLMEHATRHAPDSSRAWADLGHELLREGEPEAAWEALQRSLELEPANGVALEFAGVIQMDRGETAEAERLLLAAVDTGRNMPSLANHVGELRLRQGRLAEAENWFRQAAERLPWVPAYQWNLALALERQGRCAEASAAWSRSLELQSDAGKRRAIREHLEEVYTSPGGSCFDADG